MSAPAESPPPSAVQVHAAALCRGQWQFKQHRGAAAPRRRRGRPEQRRVTLRCAAQPKPKPAAAARAQAHAEAIRGRLWEARGIRGGGEGGALRPPPHDPRPSLLPRAPSLPALLVPSVRAVGARRSSGEGGNSPRSTRTVTSARAVRLFVHYCTRGSKCRANRARADALIGSAKRSRASTAVPRTAMWDRRAVHANARAARRSASSPFRPLSRRIWVCCYCRPSSSVRRLTRCVCSPCTSVCPVVPVLGTTRRRYWAKYASYGGVRWSFPARIRFQPMRRRHCGIVGEKVLFRMSVGGEIGRAHV